MKNKIITASIGPAEYSVLNYSDFSSASNERGLYSWHYIPHVDELEKYRTTYFNKFNLVAKSNFGSEYKGDLTPTIKNIDIICDDISHSAYKYVMAVLTPPIYVGLSINIKNRLSQHARCLDKYLDDCQANGNNNFVKENYDINTKDIDTEKESSYFGERIARCLMSSGLSRDNLYVKYFNIPDDVNLKELEKAINLGTTPSLGRR